jgi:hypothetical protein
MGFNTTCIDLPWLLSTSEGLRNLHHCPTIMSFPSHSIVLFVHSSYHLDSLVRASLPLDTISINIDNARSLAFIALPLFLHVQGDTVVKGVERRKLRILLPEDVALDEPRDPRASLVRDETASGNREDVVEFFQCSLLQRGGVSVSHLVG